MPAGPPPRTTTSYSPYSGTWRAGSSIVLEGKLGFPDGERMIMPWAGDFSYRGDTVSVAFSTRTDTQAWCCSRSAELRDWKRKGPPPLNILVSALLGLLIGAAPAL